MSRFGPVVLFARQELIDRYRGSLLGAVWLFAQPLAMILIFTVVFSDLMGARLGQSADPYAYSIYLISGVLLWNAQANILMQLAQVFQVKAPLLKKVPMSLIWMPLYIPVVEGVTYLVSMAFFGVFLFWSGHPPGATVLLAPVVVALGFAGSYLTGFILGLLSVFLPDIRSALAVALQWLFWATPIIYLPDLLPDWLRGFVGWNPLYWGPQAMQEIFLHHSAPSPATAISMSGSLLLLLILARLLQRLLERDVRDLL